MTQGRAQRHVRAQGGADASGEVHHAEPAARHARGRQADGRRLPSAPRRPREDPGGHHHRRRNPGHREVLPYRPRPPHQEQRAPEDELHGPDQRHHLVGRGPRLQDAPAERVHEVWTHRHHRCKWKLESFILLLLLLL